SLALAAWQGRVDPGLPPGESAPPEIGGYTAALLYNGLGRYEEALAAARRGSEHAELLGYRLWALPELAEAGMRCGRPDLAQEAVRQRRETTSASATDWGLGLQARSQAVIASGKAAEDLYREAIERLGRTRIRASPARAHLLEGRGVRRAKRRGGAR